MVVYPKIIKPHIKRKFIRSSITNFHVDMAQHTIISNHAENAKEKNILLSFIQITELNHDETSTLAMHFISCCANYVCRFEIRFATLTNV